MTKNTFYLEESFFPKIEKWTYRFGCSRKSNNNLEALSAVLFKLSYNIRSFNNKPMLLSAELNLSVVTFKFAKVAFTLSKVC